MRQIHEARNHSKKREDVAAAANALAARMAKEYGVKVGAPHDDGLEIRYQISGDSVLTRGLQGYVSVGLWTVIVHLDLTFMLQGMYNSIREGVCEMLDEAVR